jgi:hypothetical protein
MDAIDDEDMAEVHGQHAVDSKLRNASEIDEHRV